MGLGLLVCDCVVILHKTVSSVWLESRSPLLALKKQITMLGNPTQQGNLGAEGNLQPVRTESSNHKELNSATNCVSLEVGPSPAEPQMRSQPRPTPSWQPNETLKLRTQQNFAQAPALQKP